jgi:hypothetical protein
MDQDVVLGDELCAGRRRRPKLLWQLISMRLTFQTKIVAAEKGFCDEQGVYGSLKADNGSEEVLRRGSLVDTFVD